MFILYKGEEVVNVDNNEDLSTMIKNGWKQLTDAEIKDAGMEGYEQYVSPLNTIVDANGKITFTPPSQEELDEQAASAIRMERNNLLSKTDYLVSVDYPISEEKLAEVKAYRKALRDITEQPGFPQNVVWPKNPME